MSTALEDDLSAAISGMTVEERRTALVRLGGTPRHLNALQLKDAILTAGDLKEVAEVVRSLEVHRPHRHFLFAWVSGDIKKAIKKARRAAEDDSDGVDDQVKYIVEDKSTISVVIQRTFRRTRWVDLDDREGYEKVRGKKVEELPHRTVIRIDRERESAIASYPPLPSGVDYDYSQAISGLITRAADFDLHLQPIPLRECLSVLLKARATSVIPVRGDLFTAKADVRIRSRTGRVPIQHLVATLVDGEAAEDTDGAEALVAKISDNLGLLTFSQVSLLWKEERIVTRVEFLSNAWADFYVMWGKQTPDYAPINRISKQLSDLVSRLEKPGFEEIWDRIAGLDAGTIILPGEFGSRFTSPPDLVKDTLLEAVRLGLLEPVYRLNANAEFLEAVEGEEWTTDLAGLRQTFRTDGEEEIDGSDPSNICVAFRRIKRFAPETM